MAMMQSWWLDVRDKPSVLWAFMDRFAGNGTASFEGDLAGLNLDALPGSGSLETSALRRQTVEPLLGFTTVPITESSIYSCKRTFGRPGIFNDSGALIHVQIESDGHLVFGAYDNFHRECVIARSPTDEALLQQLKDRGLLRDFWHDGDHPRQAPA